MRFFLNLAVASLVVLSHVTIIKGQSIEGPALLPSMVSAERYIAEEISDPWHPPTNVAERTFTAPILPGPSAVGPSAAFMDAASSPANGSSGPSPATLPSEPSEELPMPGVDSATLPASDDGDELLPDGEIVLEETPWYVPQKWFAPLPWDTGLELGLNGSSGNNESMSIRTGGYVKRESRFSKLDMSGYYNKTTTRDETTQNNASVDIRNDWMLDDTSPWTLYGTSNFFYDQFQAFDVQVSANTGVGYRFVHRPELAMIGRFGGGTSREFGGPDDRWVPESLFGFEYNQHFASNQKFYGKLDYFPEWEQFGKYRMVADIGWEVELIQPENLSLKISAMDRYDSTPNGVDPHLINYSVLLLLKL